jgi:hypothetical protein
LRHVRETTNQQQLRARRGFPSLLEAADALIMPNDVALSAFLPLAHHLLARLPRTVLRYDFQLYGGTFSAGPGAPVAGWNGAPNTGPSASITQELELNIVAYPTAGPTPPTVTFQQFVLGEEQSKLLGNHRVYVPCDNPFAIIAGEQAFGEPKFQTSFYVNLPSANPAGNGVNSQEWGFQVSVQRQ